MRQDVFAIAQDYQKEVVGSDVSKHHHLAAQKKPAGLRLCGETPRFVDHFHLLLLSRELGFIGKDLATFSIIPYLC